MKNDLFTLALILCVMFLAANGMAQEAAEGTETFAPVVEGLNQAMQTPLNRPISGEGLEAWFFSFLEKLFNLVGQFIIQILQQVFAGIGGLLTGGAPATNV